MGYKKGTKHPKLNLVGRRFGRWTVLRYDSTHTGHNNYWVCRCDCGTTRSVDTSSLRNGRSSGCSKCPRPARALPGDEASFRKLYRAYKRNERGIGFSIPVEAFRLLTKSDCYYCGAAPASAYRGELAKQATPYIYNGLDRVDNDRGYTLDNVVPCCESCNRAKRNMTQQEFFRLVGRIAQRHHLIFGE